MDSVWTWLSSNTLVSNWAVAGGGAIAAYLGFRAVAFVAAETGIFAASDTSTERRFRVVVTGGSRGLGWSLARKFVELGDSVVITGRTPVLLELATTELAKHCKHGASVHSACADVADAAGMEAMASEATKLLGGKPDIWLHNAGAAQPVNKPLVDTDPADIERVVLTNSLGTLLTARAAMREMAGSPRGGHVFLMDGAGSTGMVTAGFATYGYTKAGIPQLLGSLKREARGTGVVMHALSPGMVITDLLLKGVRDVPAPKACTVANVKTIRLSQPVRSPVCRFGSCCRCWTRRRCPRVRHGSSTCLQKCQRP